MGGPIVTFCMGGVGHLRHLLPVIACLSERGRTVHVLTRSEFRPLVERAGGRFRDLFERYPIDAADAASIPLPSRFVTFAGVYGERLAADVAALAPALVVYETYSVVGPVVARRLGVPYVNVCANHAAVPARTVAALRTDPRVRISAECDAAIRRLRDVHGMPEANPFSFVETTSPVLNLYCEPAEFLDPEDQSAFEPLAFFGALAPELCEPAAASVFRRDRTRLRLYASFGTGIWRYYEPAAVAALAAVSRAATALDAELVIGLGGHALDAEARGRLSGGGVEIVDHADQWTALAEADVAITHHGLNSTHEAIFHRVPMVSYPFFGDQPALARRCQNLGLAVPLGAEPRSAIDAKSVRRSIDRIAADRSRFAERLEVARSWELRTIAGREAIVDRLLALAAD